MLLTFDSVQTQWDGAYMQAQGIPQARPSQWRDLTLHPTTHMDCDYHTWPPSHSYTTHKNRTHLTLLTPDGTISKPEQTSKNWKVRGKLDSPFTRVSSHQKSQKTGETYHNGDPSQKWLTLIYYCNIAAQLDSDFCEYHRQFNENALKISHKRIRFMCSFFLSHDLKAISNP